jgi:poly-beta-1,6-N-acetyl-D-glucosamine synthase
MIRCTVGVFAHNEVHNVRRALHALLAQQLQTVTIVEIIVIASGCTDGTVELAEEVASLNPIVRVDVETHRSGKAAAIKRLMSRARGDVIVFVSADTLPAPDSIEHLLEPFADPRVGMTGARVVPLNSPTTFFGFAVQMLWFVHHHLALRKPKLGELVACRNVIADFPEDTATDDLALEALVTRLGFQLAYAPKAIVYNRGPEDFEDFVIQRRRIFAGELGVALKYRYFASSLSIRHVLPLAVHALRSHPEYVMWTCGVMALELWSRLLGAYDAVRGRDHVVWRHAGSTKNVVSGDPVTLVSIQCPLGALDSSAVLELLRLNKDTGSVFWWDRNSGEVLLKLDGADPAKDGLKLHRMSANAEHGFGSPIGLPAPSVSWRWVQLVPTSQPPSS